VRKLFKKILLATDGSEHSLRAADKAIELAKCNPSSVIEVVYVVDEDHSKSDVLRHWNSIGISDVRMEKIKATEEKAKQANIQYQIRILRGEPGPTVVEYASKNRFDLIVIGSRGLNALQELVLGSVSHKVAKKAHCPVLIVK
jgi:nucleotide-binding universal stress UspA family protein